jgi:hypothetical protein
MQVMLTFDVEVWCGGWKDIDGRFPAAFQRYVYGASRAGDYALPKTLEVLAANDLRGVFFVEPLFAAHFGLEPLAEIVALIKAAGQEIQLHLHPEWQDEARTPLIQRHAAKRQHLFMYDADEQTQLIGHGLRLLGEVGVSGITAFRAGSYACNTDTFVALQRNGIRFDSSLNVTVGHSGADLTPDLRRHGCHCIHQVKELPVAAFESASGRLRHVQVGACAYRQMVQAMESAKRAGYRQFVAVSHNFEMLQPGSSRPDHIVARRYERLCEFLGQRRESFPTVNFGAGHFEDEQASLQMPATSLAAHFQRDAEQVARRILYRGRR